MNALRHARADTTCVDERALLTGQRIGRARTAAAGSGRTRRSWPRRATLARLIAEEAAYSTPFHFSPVLFGAGAAVYFTLAFEPEWLPLLLLAAAIAAGFAAFARLRPLLLLAFLAVAGAAGGKFQAERLATPMLGSEISTTITGQVRSFERRNSGRIRITLDVTATDRPVLRYPPQRVRVTAAALPEGVEPGDLVSGRLRLMPVQGPLRPGGYDFSYHAYFDGIGATGFFLGNPTRIGPAAEGPQLLDRIELLRKAMIGRIRHHLSGDEAEIAVALITGAQSGISAERFESLRITGLAHVLSISGLHMALVAGVVLAVIRLALALSPGIAARWPTRKIAAAGALLIISFYLLLSGAAVATLRSWIMLSIMLVAVLCGRPSLTMRNLAIAALALLIFTPHEVLDPGFQMSFAATAALISGYRAWAARRAKQAIEEPVQRRNGAQHLAGKLVRILVGMGATSLLAGLATTVIGIWHFNRVAPLSLVANLAAGPILSVLVMPFGLVSALLMPFGLEGPALTIMGEAIGWVLVIADWLAARSPADAVGELTPHAYVLACLALVLATVPATRLRLVCVPVLMLALAGWSGSSFPDVLVSEDGRLVALRRSDGLLALSRPRASAFLLRIWQDAVAAEDHVPPTRSAAGDPRPSDGEERFHCSGGACLALHNGQLVAHVQEPAAEADVCRLGPALVILADARADAGACEAKARAANAGRAPIVLTGRDLARSGSAAIHLRADGSWRLRRAIIEPWRPWHGHRAWSRAARGMGPWTPEGAAQKAPIP